MQTVIGMGVDHLNNNDSLIVSDSDVSVNEYCCQVPDQCWYFLA